MSAPAPSRAPLRVVLRRLLDYAARHKLAYAGGAAATLGYVAGFTAIPLLVGWAIAAHDHGLGAEEVTRRALWLAAAALWTAGVRFLSRVAIFNAARQIEYDLRSDLFAHLQRLPQSFYSRWRTGDIMSRCVNDVNAVRLLLGVGVLNVLQTPLLYLLAIVAMLAINAKLALLVLLPYPAFLWIARTFGRTVYRWSLATQEGLSDMSSQLQEVVSGIAVVKAYAMEGETAKRFEEVNSRQFRRQLHLVRAMAAMPPIVAMLPASAMVVVLLGGGGEILAGRMERADFFTFAMYVYQLTFPTFILGWVVALVQRGAASMQRLDDLLSVEPSIADRSDAVPEQAVRGEIEFRKLTFRYPGDRAEPALRGIDLHVPAGSTLGVVGPVGSGKSTLASVIPRLYEVEEGQLLIDGVDVNRIPLATLRSSIAMVPQESFLFSMTLEQNIAFGLETDDPEVVRAAATAAQLDQDIGELPHGYHTVVGERGVMLSGGQRQRAALARALAVHPRILILDDVLSSVDAETEAGIVRELERVFAGRTVVVVSHRVSAVRDADQIVVLDGGELVERGTHAELIAAGGLYARLASEQAREEALADSLEALEVTA